MTFDEIQTTIEGMLAVQRELQESQLRQQQESAKFERNTQAIHQELDRMLAVQRDLQESQIRLLAAQREQGRMINQLIGYSLTNETEHLDLQERMNQLEERLRQRDS